MSLEQITVATLPNPALNYDKKFLITDCEQPDSWSTGGGPYQVVAWSNGNNWVPVGGGGVQYHVHEIAAIIGLSSAMGNKCANSDSRLSDARTPTAHAATHKNGGSDEVATATAGANLIPKAGAGGTLAIGWVPTGSTSSAVCIGNDSRLSDSRAPNGTAAGDLAGSYPNPTIKASVSLTSPVIGAATGTSLATTGAVTSSGTAGMGYATGAGGVVTQNTSKSTGVTLSKVCGEITMNAAALAAGAIVSFTLTNTTIAAKDVLIINHASGGTAGAYTINAQCAAGSAVISVRNATAASLSEAIVIRFALIKAVIA